MWQSHDWDMSVLRRRVCWAGPGYHGSCGYQYAAWDAEYAGNVCVDACVGGMGLTPEIWEMEARPCSARLLGASNTLQRSPTGSHSVGSSLALQWVEWES